MISTTTYKLNSKKEKRLLNISRELLSMSLRDLKPIEINLLYGLLYVASRNSHGITKTNYKELRNITQNPSRHKTRLLSQVEGMNERINGDGRLFETLIVDYDKDEIILQPSKLLSNHLNKDKTVDLNILFNLESVYSKKIYLVICAYDNGWFYIKTDVFRDFLNVPKSYKMSKIDNHVTKPALKELNEYMSVRLEKIKFEGVGNKIQGFKFIYPKKESEEKRSKNVKVNKVTEDSLELDSNKNLSFTFNFNINN